MKCFVTLGIEQDSSEDEIKLAFRKRLAALRKPHDDTKLRELITAREEALRLTRQPPSTLPRASSLQLLNDDRRALIQYQEAATQFTRSTKTLLSRRITPVLRIRTFAAILAILAGAIGALSNERINPLLRTMFASEYEVKQHIIDDQIDKGIQRLELELNIANSDYEKLLPRITDISNIRKFELLSRLSRTWYRNSLLYGNEQMERLNELDSSNNQSELNHKDFRDTACRYVPDESANPSHWVREANQYCNTYSRFVNQSTFIWPSIASTILLGIRPVDVSWIVGVDVRDLSAQLEKVSTKFESIIMEIQYSSVMHDGLYGYYRTNLELTILAWLYEVRDSLEKPATEAIQGRKRWTDLVSVTSLSLSGVLTLLIPILLLIAARRTRQIEWLIENLEDRTIVYRLIECVFGLESNSSGWEASNGPNMVKNWMEGDSLNEELMTTEFESIRSAVNLNLDAVSFHRLLTASALKCGCLLQRYEKQDGRISLRYFVTTPES